MHTFSAFHAHAVEVDPSWRVVGNHHIEVVGAQSACLLDALLHVKNILLENSIKSFIQISLSYIRTFDNQKLEKEEFYFKDNRKIF